MGLLFNILKLSMKNLRANKMRSFLTVLGIQIGVGAVIAMMAIGYGAQQSMTEMIRGFGSNLIMLTPNYRSSGGVKLDYVERLTIDDCRALLAEVPELAMVSPQVSRQVQIKHGNTNQRAQVTGVSGPYFEMMNIDFSLGRTFNAIEEESIGKVTIVGHNIVEEFFFGREEDAVGNSIKIDGTSYMIVGALAKKGGPDGMNSDKALYVPFGTAMKRLLGSKYIHAITISVSDESLNEKALAGVTRVMRKRHRLTEDKEDDFQIFSFEDALSTMRSATQIFTILVAGIAGISLLVGGIGIMNVMLVTVIERTPEIGIRKALGAKRKDILVQFLIESTVISLLGGAFGIALGASLVYVINIAALLMPQDPDQDMTFRAAISPMSLVVSLGFCLFIGLFFGIYPARRAAKLSPIAALQRE